MRINRSKGKTTISLVKAEVRTLLDASYMVADIANNVSPEERSRLNEAVMALRGVCSAYGGQYLTEDGQLVEPEHRKRDESEAPNSAAVLAG